jgi:hypothetical protein
MTQTQTAYHVRAIFLDQQGDAELFRWCGENYCRILHQLLHPNGKQHLWISFPDDETAMAFLLRWS